MFFEERYFKKYDVKVKLIYSNLQLDTVASYIPKFNLFIVDNTASEEEINKAVLHELGHLIKHTDIKELYNCTSVCRLKMEHEANQFMVDELIDDYLQDSNTDPESVNYIDFANNNHIHETYMIKQAIQNHIKRDASSY